MLRTLWVGTSFRNIIVLVFLCAYRHVYSLTEIFKAPLMEETPLHIDPDLKLALEVRDATFEWEESLAAKEAKEAQARKKKGKGPANDATATNIDEIPPFQLKDVTLLVPRGSLVAVVGPVGCGKVSS